jgi:PAS domain S-box-containing protein
MNKTPDLTPTEPTSVRLPGAGLAAAPSDASATRVLLIEDDVDDALLVHEMLQEAAKHRFQVERAERLSAGLEKMSARQPDAVLLDLNLPDSFGIDSFRQVHERYPEVPIVVLTGLGSEELGLLAVSSGAQDYLVKGALTENVLNRVLRYAIERQRSSAELLRLKTAIEYSGNAIVVTDFEAQIEYVNPAFTRITGYSREEALGKSTRIFKSGRHGAEFYREMWSTILAGSTWRGDMINRRKDGTLYCENMTVAPVRHPHGHITHFIAIKQDITARKLAEERFQELNASLERRVAERTAELAKAMKALRGEIAEREMAEAALERLHQETELILNSAGDAIFRLCRDGNVTFANPAASRMLGYGHEELIGRHLHTFTRHALPDGTPCGLDECGVNAALGQGEARRSENHIVYRKDGTSLPVDIVAAPIKDRSAVVGAVVAYHDVGERLAAEKMKHEFLAILSHELRSPLTSIRGALGLLDAGRFRDQPDQTRHLIEIAARNSKRLMRLISDILDSQRMEEGVLSLVRRRCLASDLTIQAAELIEPMARAAGVKLEAEAPPIELNVDPDGMLQVLTNLLSNAVKFSDAGSTVRITARSQGNEATFEVADEGQGIPAANLESIFERFRPVDASDSRRRGGSGLGLSICRRIVQHHGGRIWARSELGRGSTFIFTVPLEPIVEGSMNSGGEDGSAPQAEVAFDA